MKVSRQNGTITIVPHGAVSEYSDEAHAELMALMYEVVMFDNRPEPKVLIDLSEVSFMNSTGLSQLVHIYLTTRTRGGRFAICGATPRVRKIIKLVKLDTIVHEFPDRETALAAWNRSEG